ncbi:hypothetical protein FXO38_36226 [Capsicum annuum]|uniref:Uncharacterized protein n=1 Tax=Capsicum annuum TaxID=4072 RepID=A0A2G2YVD9_CAPAN|nr:hypothetical protein FXO38_36226 [Capsicum annuum]PHT73693.1 hypothetical protein T459_24478 [Capsicum annuum]
MPREPKLLFSFPYLYITASTLKAISFQVERLFKSVLSHLLVSKCLRPCLSFPTISAKCFIPLFLGELLHSSLSLSILKHFRLELYSFELATLLDLSFKTHSLSLLKQS